MGLLSRFEGWRMSVRHDGNNVLVGREVDVNDDSDANGRRRSCCKSANAL